MNETALMMIKLEIYRTWLYLLFLILNPGCSNSSSSNDEAPNTTETIPSEAIYALEDVQDLDILLEEIGDAELVLLGEASHGTSEFYTWRAELSKRLILEKGFTLITIEGDWSDALPLNDYIKGTSAYTSAQAALENFDRWPQWMWANEEILQLAEWLKAFNSEEKDAEQVGFYGLDVYGIWESLQELHDFLLSNYPEAAETTGAVIACFAPYDENENAYASATVNEGVSCEAVITEMVDRLESIFDDPEALSEAEFNALQHAYVVANAETYYRTSPGSYATSWNVRDLHMAGTIDRLKDHYGEGTKMIIWEHNTHVGDARATDMVDAGMVNVGQLARETYREDNVYIVGFGTYAGEVIAAQSWGSPARVMKVPPARRNSWEWLLHNREPKDKIILMEPLKDIAAYKERIGHRAIGVVYDPKRESGNYVPSILPQRYDAFIFIDQTSALKPVLNE